MTLPRQPRYQDQKTTPVANLGYAIDQVMEWYRPEGQPELGFYRVLLLTRNNVAHFTALFGKHHQVFDGEYRYKMWRREHQGLVFWLSAHHKKGTSIEVELADRGEPWQPDHGWTLEMCGKVVSFLDELFRRLHACAPDYMPGGWQPDPADIQLRDPPKEDAAEVPTP